MFAEIKIDSWLLRIDLELTTFKKKQKKTINRKIEMDHTVVMHCHTGFAAYDRNYQEWNLILDVNWVFVN